MNLFNLTRFFSSFHCSALFTSLFPFGQTKKGKQWNFNKIKKKTSKTFGLLWNEKKNTLINTFNYRSLELKWTCLRLLSSQQKLKELLEQKNWKAKHLTIFGTFRKSFFSLNNKKLPGKGIHSVIIITKNKSSCFQRMHLGWVMCVKWACRFVYLQCLECLKSKKTDVTIVKVKKEEVCFLLPSERQRRFNISSHLPDPWSVCIRDSVDQSGFIFLIQSNWTWQMSVKIYRQTNVFITSERNWCESKNE